MDKAKSQRSASDTIHSSSASDSKHTISRPDPLHLPVQTCAVDVRQPSARRLVKGDADVRYRMTIKIRVAGQHRIQ